MTPIYVIVFIILNVISAAAKREDDLRVILCDHLNLQNAIECENDILSSTTTLSTASDNELEDVAVASLSMIEKCLISVITAIFLYFFIVFVLKFGTGLSWRHSFMLAVSRGNRLCNSCVLTIYAGHEIPDVEVVAVENDQSQSQC
jgi:hypothetical protein